jgi:hypothetical protein
MKKHVIMVVVCLAAVAGCSAYGPGPDGGGVFIGGRDSVDDNYFFDYLSPYGSWVEFRPYGYVWCPANLGYGWRPYSHGHWVWTDYGWTWISDYDWGWMPFHYGRWGWDDGLGWFWVPGTVWGPAWVTWSWSDFYVGWAPLPPYAEFIPGVGIRLGRPIPLNYWCFVEGPRFLNKNIWPHIFPFERNEFIYNRAVRRDNLRFDGRRIINRGVGIDEISRWTGSGVSRYRIEDAGQPGIVRIEGDKIRIYRPPILRSEGARPKAFIPRAEAPQRIEERRREYLREDGRRGEAERTMRESHERQERIMDQSQRRDREEILRQQQEEMKRSADQAAREKARQQNRVRQEELRRQQDRERSEMQRRHEQEKQSTRGARPQGKPRKGDG